MAQISIVPYTDEYMDRWDSFVMSQSVNGTMLQTRKFLNYHPKGRFTDSSLLVLKGTEIIAVIPANIVVKDKQRILYSHQGSTFGGIVISKNNIKVSVVTKIFEELNRYCIDNRINEAVFKLTSWLYSSSNSELLDYMFFNQGYSCSMEVGYFVDFAHYNEDTSSNYSSSIRRHYKASEKNGLLFRELVDRDGIALFYETLLDNYKKFDADPVHTLEDLYLLKEQVIKDKVRFFGVFKEDIIVASSMVFDFNHRVFHTQYLATKSSYNRLYANEYLYTGLLNKGREEGFQYLSFGTSTLDKGKVLNYNLAQYKEQYGTDQYVNRTYYKVF